MQPTAIEIVPYDPRWPEEFRQIAAALRAAMGEAAARIDHIGSTSVPGLAAKDIIDVQVSVAVLDAETIAPLLAPLGYALRPDFTCDHVPPGADEAPEQWAKLFFRPPATQRRTNLHIRRLGSANQRYALLFRDYLRADAQSAAAYRQIKEVLARQHPYDIEAYLDVKDPVCDIIMRGAASWARVTGYVLGPSDM